MNLRRPSPSLNVVKDRDIMLIWIYEDVKKFGIFIISRFQIW